MSVQEVRNPVDIIDTALELGEASLGPVQSGLVKLSLRRPENALVEWSVRFE